jgi:lipase chaperone LimK
VESPWGRRVFAALAVVGLVFGVRHCWMDPDRPAGPVASKSAETQTKARPRQRAPAIAMTAEPALTQRPTPAMPASLRDTARDGALRVDAAGNLIVGPEILALFDYYFSATGEESAEIIRARILAAIGAELTGPAAARAIALLDHYIDYREATRALRDDGSTDLAGRLDALRGLRRKHFGEEDATKLFGEQERADAVAIEQRRVSEDRSLSPEERDQRLARLEQDLPESIRAPRSEAVRPQRQQAEEQAMRAEGAGDEEIRRHRVETVGEEAADRLEALDQRRSEWKRRLAEFQAKRAAIVASEPNESAQRAAVERLLHESFTAEEQIRVRAADAIPARE